MKKEFLLLTAIIITGLIMVSCSNTSDPVQVNQKADKSLDNNANIFLNPNCQPVVVNLVIDDDLSDYAGANAVKVGTVDFRNTPDNLLITFQLDPTYINLGYTLSTVAGMGYIIQGDPYRQDYYSMHFKEEDIQAQNLTTYTISIPRVLYGSEFPYPNLTWNCGNVLALWAYAKICTPGGGQYGAGITYSLTGDGLQNGKISHPIIAGQKYNAGTISVEIDGTDLVFTYNLTNDWVLKDIHFDFQDECSQIPQNNKGKFIPGQFPAPWKYEFSSPYTKRTYTIRVPITEALCGKDFCVAAHCSVIGVGTWNKNQSQTGWGGNIEDPLQASWQYHFQFGLQCIPNYGGGDPQCHNTWALGRDNICYPPFVYQPVPRSWYFGNWGYVYCCQ